MFLRTSNNKKPYLDPKGFIDLIFSKFRQEFCEFCLRRAMTVNYITSIILLLVYAFLTVLMRANTERCCNTNVPSSDTNILSSNLAGQGRLESHMKAKEESAPATSAIFSVFNLMIS